ncbi:MAG: porin family protein [Bacteroidota bacterium]
MTNAQNFDQINLPDYDNRVLHFGFTLGAHQSSYRLTYNDDYVAEWLDTLHSIQVTQQFGFSIGFLANFHILQYLDLRPMFKVSFYEYELQYNFLNDQPTVPRRVEAAYVELPLTVKYRSLRRKNFGMYLVGGITPGIQVGGRPDDDQDPTILHTHDENLSLEYGLGLDIYYPLFKFSPEIRVSHGIRNQVKPDISVWSNGIDRLVTHSVSLYLNFQ